MVAMSVHRSKLLRIAIDIRAVLVHSARPIAQSECFAQCKAFAYPKNGSLSIGNCQLTYVFKSQETSIQLRVESNVTSDSQEAPVPL